MLPTSPTPLPTPSAKSHPQSSPVPSEAENSTLWVDISAVISRYCDAASENLTAFCSCTYGAITATLTLSPLTVSILILKLTVSQVYGFYMPK